MDNRFAMFGPSVVNPSAGGLLGGTTYQGSGREAATATSPRAIRSPSARGSESPTSWIPRRFCAADGALFTARRQPPATSPTRPSAGWVGTSSASPPGTMAHRRYSCRMACSSPRRFDRRHALTRPFSLYRPDQLAALLHRPQRRPASQNQPVEHLRAAPASPATWCWKPPSWATRASGFGPIPWRA